MKIDRQAIGLEDFVGNKALHVRFRIEVSCDSKALTISSRQIKDKEGRELCYSFPIDDQLFINLLSRQGGSQAIQVQSVQKGTMVSGYRELTVSADGSTATKEGLLSRQYHRYGL